jgi:rhodanese-related sulfurtransferase/ubiquinone/menaquinone biosynthesis C-methylase UbiE
MVRMHRFLIVLTLIAPFVLAGHRTFAQSHQSTRITDVAEHRRGGDKRYPYRAKSDYILKELDIQMGDAVVDIGAGDGWWTEKFAESVGESGVVHAAEVAEEKVVQMRNRFASTPQVKPYLIESDSTGLPENSCDVAFFSQSYHHLNEDGHVDYLKHLHSVIKPTGRVVIVEKYTETGLGWGTHGTRLSRLVRQAEEAGWVPLRLELMKGTYHYVAILAQQELFPPEPKKKKTSSASEPTKKPEGKEHTSDSLVMVQKRLADQTAVLIDVREKNEWDAGHLPQAKLIPLSQLRNRAGQSEYGKELAKILPQERIIYCHCRSGGRVLIAGPILKKMGYDVRPLKAGYADLLKAGF